MKTYVADETVIATVESAVALLFDVERQIVEGKIPRHVRQEMPADQRRRHVAGLSAAGMLRAGIQGVPQVYRSGPFTVVKEPETYGQVYAREADGIYRKCISLAPLGERGVRDYFTVCAYELHFALLSPQAVAAFKRWRTSKRNRYGRHRR